MAAPKLAGLAHIVLRVGDLDRAVDFYERVLGLQVRHRFRGMAFLSSPGSDLSHELGLAELGQGAPPPDPHRVGMYHFAWQLSSVDELERFHDHLVEQSANIVGYGDHGASFGIYFNDPDGNEIEVFYELPTDQWPGGGDDFRGHFPLPISFRPARARPLV